MILDVLIYKYAPSNPLKLPADYPYDCREVSDDAPLPSNPWQRMTVEQLDELKASMADKLPNLQEL